MTQPGGQTAQGHAFPPMPRQRALGGIEVLRFVCGYREAHGVVPTIRAISAGTGIAVATVCKRLWRLEETGAIRRMARRAQAIDVLRPVAVPRAPDGAPLFFVPVVHGAGISEGGKQDHA